MSLERARERWRWAPTFPGWALALVSLALGAVYAWAVEPGLPYDEPSHWSTVLYYTDHMRMPVLGDPGVTYEAQMGPVAYAVDAVAVGAVRTAGGSTETAFRLVRLLGVIEFAAAAVVVASLTRRLVPVGWAWIAATAVFALNPMLLTMSASVQNDTLALLLGALTLLLALEWRDSRPSAVSAGALGFLAGLAILTKLTAWAVVVTIGAWLAWRHGRRAAVALASFLAGALIASGWWFVRNAVLYGDPTGGTGVERTGVTFAPYRLNEASDVGHVIQQVVTYLWLPTEYVRNEIGAPPLLKSALLLVTLAILGFGIARSRGLRSGGGRLIVGCGLISILAWLVVYFGVQAVAPRVAYLAVPLWVAVVALAVVERPLVWLAGAATLLAAVNAWTLYELWHVTAPTFIRFSP